MTSPISLHCVTVYHCISAHGDPLYLALCILTLCIDPFCGGVQTIDLYKVKVADLDFESNFTLKVKHDDYIHAFVSFFDCLFSKCHTKVSFTTAPWGQYTHWKQTVFYLDECLMASKGTQIKGHIKVHHNSKNPRDLDIDIKSKYTSAKAGTVEQERRYFMR